MTRFRVPVAVLTLALSVLPAIAQPKASAAPLDRASSAGPDLARLRATPLKEPAYTCKRPLYGLAAFGPRAEKAVWMVLDKSKPEGSLYDVLFIDRQGDGDLTREGQRLTPGADKHFRLPNFIDPATGVKHGDLAVRVEGDNPTVMLRLRWRNKFSFGGGYPEESEQGYLRFSERAAEAPVVWLCGDEPFRFQRWYGGKLPIGGKEDFKVFLGQPGRGPSTFCAAQEHILPAQEWVKATLLYRDRQGKEQRLVCELRERC
jgi:hypothetical protein